MATATAGNLVAGDKSVLWYSGAGLDPGVGDYAFHLHFNATNVTGVQTLYLMGSQGAAADYLWLMLSANRVRFQLNDASGAYLDYTNTDVAVTAGVWNDLAVNCDRDGNATFWLNGTEYTFGSIAAKTGNLTPNVARVGAYGSSSTNAFSGAICGLSVYNRLLTPSDIALLHNGTPGSTGRLRPYAQYPASLLSGLVSHWPLNGGGGVDGTAFDATHGAVDLHGGNDLSFAAAGIINATTANGGLETWTTPTNAANWQEYISGTSTINQETTTVYAGSSACRFDLDALGSAAYLSQNVLTSGKLYGFSMYARLLNALATQGAYVGFGSFANSLGFTLGTSYSQYSGSLRANGVPLYIVRGGSSGPVVTANSIYLDNITLTAAEILTTTGPEMTTPFRPWIMRRRRRMAGAR